ncbi:non-homologous end-joining factor 1 [Denticeps clupeoides]|uniref:Non-homologous end-joining factor 1 n=1 Tax=Denticeps clupeoides TaxID=299321 RepID=A0AAY4EZM2_9TELE|nr:non-homologous end-joining factor 1 [Denticeps clupeoides]
MDAAGVTKPWVPVWIDDSRLLAKAWFGDTQYRVLLSDLDCVWEETMDASSIQSRSQELNKRLRAPPQAFFSHLCSVAGPCFSGQASVDNKDTAHFSLQHRDNQLTVRLKSELAGVPFYWEFRCGPTSLSVVCRELVCPLVVMSRALQRQVEELGAMLVRKDAEIQDYKENGAVLSRERLQTDVFEEQSYRENFMTQTLPQMGLLRDRLGFSSELQELYVAVSQRDAFKRRRSSGDTGTADGTDEQDRDHAAALTVPKQSSTTISGFGQNATSCRREKSSGESDGGGATGGSQEAASEQTVIPPATQRPSTTQPKKKKAVGLFR